MLIYGNFHTAKCKMASILGETLKPSMRDICGEVFGNKFLSVTQVGSFAPHFC